MTLKQLERFAANYIKRAETKKTSKYKREKFLCF